MKIFVNDLSLDGGFEDIESARVAITELAAARARSVELKRTLLCSRLLLSRPASGGASLQQTLMSLPSDDRRAILLWLGQSGPFSDDLREDFEEDLFFLDGEEVTDISLGEAARCQISEQSVGVFSFKDGSVRRFDFTPLKVVHGFVEDPIQTIDIQNVWLIAELLNLARSARPAPSTWVELVNVCRERFGRLAIGDYCLEALRPHPFSSAIADRVVSLLSILQQMMEDMDDAGRLGSRGKSMLQQFFVGDRALFSDESDDNKHRFAGEMTFPDPLVEGIDIVCFWHGKIRTSQFRIHFEWPVTAPFQRLKVAYIGPKISKK